MYYFVFIKIDIFRREDKLGVQGLCKYVNGNGISTLFAIHYDVNSFIFIK